MQLLRPVETPLTASRWTVCPESLNRLCVLWHNVSYIDWILERVWNAHLTRFDHGTQIGGHLSSGIMGYRGRQVVATGRSGQNWNEW
jgi:hypothetical protein